MDSSNSTLTPLQQSVLNALPESESFFLSGGAALAAYYLGHRRSLDLDLFTDDPEVIAQIERHLRDAAAGHGWTVTVQQSAPGFRRLLVRAGDEETLVDLVHDPVDQIVPVSEKPRSGRICYDALEDLVANKLNALLGRGDVKDLVDLYFLAEKGVDVLASMGDARRKDGGMEPATLGWVLRGVSPDPSRLLLLRPVSASDLARFRDDMVRRLLEMAWPVDPRGPSG